MPRFHKKGYTIYVYPRESFTHNDTIELVNPNQELIGHYNTLNEALDAIDRDKAKLTIGWRMSTLVP